MGRSRAFDLLQNYTFWLTEITFSARPPFLVLGEVFFGFNTITTPEITLEMAEIVEFGTMVKTPYYSGMSVAPITLTRGAGPYDSTMYRWINRSMRGEDRVQRSLALFHNMALNSGIDSSDNSSDLAFGGLVGMRRVNGRGWLLWDCIPTRYKAGSDMDATSGDVSIMELDVQPRMVTEFSLDPRMLTDLNV